MVNFSLKFARKKPKSAPISRLSPLFEFLSNQKKFVFGFSMFFRSSIAKSAEICYNRFMNNLLASPAYYIIIGIAIAVVVTIILFVIVKLLEKKREPHYYLKDSLLTPLEIEYYKVLDDYFGKDYRILPQINLASVIDKEGGGFRTELFRNADFGIFDMNFRPILLIEINDNTHFRKDRQERDASVALILKKAHIPLVTFWTKDGIDRKRIYNEIRKYL